MNVDFSARNNNSSNILEVRNLSYVYQDEPEPVLRDINLFIPRGELVILTGPSGCGKSTLCRHFNGIIPHLSSGTITSGEVHVNGINVAKTPVHQLATLVGMVHQNPESQIVCLEVMDEIAFGPENIGLSHEEIVQRVNLVIDQVKLHEIAELLTFECSGGQKQRVAIGSSLALLPDLMVLDEPTTDLDPVGKQEVVKTVNDLRQKLGITFLIVEHNLDELLAFADRLVVMVAGRIVFNGHPDEIINCHYDELIEIGLRMPQHILISKRLVQTTGSPDRFSLQPEEAIRRFSHWANGLNTRIQLPASNPRPHKTMHNARPAVEITDVSFSYGTNNVLQDINLKIMPGEFVGLVGANGSGKSTLARLIIGLLKPQKGYISVFRKKTTEISVEDLSQKVGYLFQNPDSQLFNTSVESEVAFGMRVRNRPKEEIQQRVDEVLTMLRLTQYRDRHPFALSRGERQRLALATVLVTDPDLIILDEPTTGQDRRMLESLIDLMNQWIQRKRATVIMIAHDMDLVCKYAERTVVMSGGQMVADGFTAEVFYKHYMTLKDLSLTPPPVVEISYPLVGSALPRLLLSMQEFEHLLSQQVRTP